MNTFDRTVRELCEEVDFFREEAAYWKSKYDDLVKEQIRDSQERYESAQKGLANMLSVCLSIQQDEAGSLVIPMEARKEISENWKS